jgi:NAD(P)-dependent dehydrogenase (short-subunit alcohol dehydrogenase family)
MEKTVLVTGATGTVGRDVAKLLSKKGAAVRAGVRDQAKARKQFGAEIALATFDFEDAASFPGALKGLEKVFLLPPLMPNQLELAKCICRCSEARGRASHRKTVRDRGRCQPTIHLWKMARRQ